MALLEKDEISGKGTPSPVYALPARLGRYTLTERIGVGGMAEVFVAVADGPVGFQKKVVVKRILPHLAEDQHFVQMFQREARVAAGLNHSNVVQVYELGEDSGAYFIAMELVDGLTVQRLARRAWKAGRAIPLEVVCGIIADAALGLDHAHEQQVMHRDVSPENLMMNSEGVTKVLDFGIARSATNPSLTQTGELKGKIPFLSPEAIRGDVIDGRSDLYALGVTMYWLLTGRRPLKSPSDLMLLNATLTEIPRAPRHYNPQIPRGVDALACALLEKDPNKRPPNGKAIHDALAPDLPARSLLAAPFLREVMTLADAEPGFDAPSKESFVPSTPKTGREISGWRVHRDDVTAAHNKRRGVIAGLGAAAVLALGVGGGVILLAEDEPAARSVAEAEAEAEAEAKKPSADDLQAFEAAKRRLEEENAKPVDAQPVNEGEALAPVVTVGEASDNGDDKSDDKTAKRAVKMKKLELRAPAHVKWAIAKGKSLGSGNATSDVPSDAKSVVAFDTKRGVRTTLPVTSGVVDYASAPRGKLDLRAFPYADVFVGGEALGVTPLQPFAAVAGTYTVRFVYKGKEQKRTVTVGANRTERVIVDFR